MMMQLNVDAGARPEAMADVPGVSELPLSRAVVQYRDVHETGLAGGRIQDIGLALVLEGRHPSAAEAIDLGSAEVKRLDLSTELVILDWVYEPTLEHVSGLVRRVAEGESRDAELAPYCFDLALHVLARIGYGALTRPTLLRVGFRDVCRDLDLHEGTSVRIVLGEGRITRAHLDYDACALAFRTATPGEEPLLEAALGRAFPGGDVRRVEAEEGRGPGRYQVRFPLPLGLEETRDLLGRIRGGLAGLLERFEPERYRALRDVVETLGARDTLARLRIREPSHRAVPLRPPTSERPPLSTRVH